MFCFSNINGFTVSFFLLCFFSPGPMQIIDARLAEIDWPVPRTREAWQWSQPRRHATVPCAMTMLQATIMESGLVRAARPFSREVFKVIVCRKQLASILDQVASEHLKCKTRAFLCAKHANLVSSLTSLTETERTLESKSSWSIGGQLGLTSQFPSAAKI